MPESPPYAPEGTLRAIGQNDDPPCAEKPRTRPATDDLDAQLRALMARGFSFAHPCHPGGDILAVVGVRAHHDVVDIVQLFGEDNADAARIPGDEPDILFPQRVVWRATGPAHEVLKRILDLDDDKPTATDAPQRGWWISASSAPAPDTGRSC